ncbi:hypothetical protein, partial [Pseudomonas syringae]|uniref:hypothetical protein n=1 Tax=Pseudomonas syringae TaxID=317 RepID=UPI001F17AB09
VRGVSACVYRRIRNRKSSSGSWAARIRWSGDFRIPRTCSENPKRIADARRDFMPTYADSLARKQVKVQESLNYVVGNFEQPGITAHARRAIKKELSLARKELKRIPPVKNIRNPSPAPARSKAHWLNGPQQRDRFKFNPEY